MSVPVCGSLLTPRSLPLPGGALCVPPEARSDAAACVCLQCRVYKRPISVSPFWAWVVFAELEECHGIIPSVLPLLLNRDDQNMFMKNAFSSLMCFNFLTVSIGSTTKFSSVVISPPGQGKIKRPAFGLGANRLICKFSKYWVLQDKRDLAIELDTV